MKLFIIIKSEPLINNQTDSSEKNHTASRRLSGEYESDPTPL
jgi:hypothetical protein